MVKVSVIIPVYNAEKYLRTALDSVVCQTLKNIEIICVDDGSTDSSFAILQEYAEKDHRFILLHQENQYAGAARNHGMSVAKGEYLSFLDADDCFKPDMLEKAYQCGVQEDADVVVFGVSCFKHNTEDIFHGDWSLVESQLPGGDSFKPYENSHFLLNFSGTAAWNKIFRTDFLKKRKLRFQEIKRWNDVSFVISALALSSRGVGLVREDLICHRIGNAESLQGSRDEQILDFVDAFCEAYHILERNKVHFEILNSLRNECIHQLLAVLWESTFQEALEKLYAAFKNQIYHELHFADMKQEDFLSPYLSQKSCFIQEHTVFEYLFRMYRELSVFANREIEEYIFPFESVGKNAKIILYGAGKVGHAYYRQIQSTGYCTIVAWVDQRSKLFHDPRIDSVDEIACHDMEHLVIAIGNESVASDVCHALIETYGIAPQKIVWKNPMLK